LTEKTPFLDETFTTFSGSAVQVKEYAPEKATFADVSGTENICIMNFVKYFLACLFPVFLSACKPEVRQETLPGAAKDTYFSVKQFLDDQWRMKGGQPYVLLRNTFFNGKADSAYVPLDSALWQTIRGQFDAADISASKFLGQYTFELYEDRDMGLVNYDYEAKRPELFTRRMIISADNFSNRIRSVYIETERRNKVYVRTQKLNYVPDNFIQLQEFQKSVATPAARLQVDYYFRY